eukprot:1042986-Amphidinium_carterae.2
MPWNPGPTPPCLHHVVVEDDDGLDGEDEVGPDGPWDAPQPAPESMTLQTTALDKPWWRPPARCGSGTLVSAQLTFHGPLCNTVCSTDLRYCEILAPNSSNC